MEDREILGLLRENARRSTSEIASMLGVDVGEVERRVSELEADGVILGYRAVVDESKLPETRVKAIIEVKIRPSGADGFDGLAKRLARFDEVESLYLVSGEYDLELEVHGASLGDVAAFVSGKLATTAGVEASATRFILKKYKEANRMFGDDDGGERLKISP